MCYPRNRIVALIAIKEYLEQQIAELRAGDPGEQTLERRAADLETVNDELESLMADPRTLPLVGGCSSPGPR